MPDSVYKIIELVGTSDVSWEEAAKTAVNTACKSLKNLRIAEVSKLDLKVEDSPTAQESMFRSNMIRDVSIRSL